MKPIYCELLSMKQNNEKNYALFFNKFSVMPFQKTTSGLRIRQACVPVLREIIDISQQMLDKVM